MKLQKRYAIVFFFLLSLPIFVMLCLQIYQQAVQHAMKEKLEEEMLHTVILAKSDVVWAKKHSEIILNGRMFDVKSFTEENEAITFTGLFDDEETAIEAFIHQKATDQSPLQKKSLLNFFQLFLAVFKFNAIQDSMADLLVPVKHTITDKSFLPNENSEVSTPPPQA